MKPDPLERARELLQKWPNLVHRETANSITLDAPSPTGFSASFHVAKDEFVVSFDGWHDHFETEGEALKCFEFGLVGPCRLKVCREIIYRQNGIILPKSQGAGH